MKVAVTMTIALAVAVSVRAQTPGERRFDIPAQPLATALTTFGRQSNLQVSAPAELLKGKTSTAVAGVLSPARALGQMLTGTGLTFRVTGNTVTLEPAPEQSGGAIQLGPVRVEDTAQADAGAPARGGIGNLRQDGSAKEGYRSREVSQVGPWQGRKLDDLPYSITVLPSQLIENTGGVNPDQLFRINPTTQINRPLYANNQPSVNMRGFQVGQFYRDGLPTTQYNHDITLEDTERMEVLSGLSGFLYGAGGNVGGIVNYVTKRPTAERLNRVTLRNNGGGNFHLHGDFGGPIDRNGRLGYRINAAQQGRETAVDGLALRRTLISSAFDWHATDALLVQASFTDSDFYLTGNQPYWNATTATRPTAGSIDSSRTWGQPWTDRHYETTTYGANVRWAATKRVAVRAGWLESDGRRYQPDTFNTFQADGTYIQTIDTYRYGFEPKRYEPQHESRYQLFADVTFETGGISHQLTTGTQYYDYERRRLQNVVPPVTTLTGTRLGSGPTYIARPAFAPTDQGPMVPQTAGGATTLSLGDDIRINERWSVLVGLAHSTITRRDAGAAAYDESAVTPTTSLIYKPRPTVTTYATYMQALEQGAIAADRFNGQPVVNAGEVMKPLVSDQLEGGVKVSAGGLLLTTALFQIDKSLQYYDIRNPTAPVFVQDGRQVHRGVEFTAFGRVAQRVSLVGGLTLLDPAVRRQQQNPALEGKRATRVAERLVKLRAEYDTPWLTGLTLVGSFNHTSDQYADPMNTDRLSSFTLLDVGARFATVLAGKPLTMFLEAQNVGDKRYWTDGGQRIGDPRALMFSVSTGF